MIKLIAAPLYSNPLSIQLAQNYQENLSKQRA